ncbi:hypothetical protein [Pseudalkalibacillus caeni]|uniref:Uncharacterized protein n=1 Tax=Exobacillus caeni TaxID=2574798 RepID=A0A5R9F663_9BACL|nr:hypothetical protein [Pseudalkalibacillus caeni]TLS37118.1 hypothetical protein FCL54_11360 [Pseudalkalibacillus caeni]
MFEHLGISFVWLLVAYTAVTVVGIIHMYIFHIYFGVPNAKQAGTSYLKSPAYVKTIPYQALYNVVLFPVFLWFYSLGVETDNLKELMFYTVIQWTAMSIILDYVGWVLIPHPFRFTIKEFYVDYQPWISLIYLAIFVSHYIAGFFI